MSQPLLEDTPQYCPKLMIEGWAPKKRTLLKGHVVRKGDDGGGGGAQKKGDFIFLAKMMRVSQ